MGNSYTFINLISAIDIKLTFYFIHVTYSNLSLKHILSVCPWHRRRRDKSKIQIYGKGQKSLPKIIILIAGPFPPVSLRKLQVEL